MLLKYLKRPLPSVLVIIIIFAVLGWFKAFISGDVSKISFNNYPMPLYALVKNLSVFGDLFSKFASFSMILISALYLIQLNIKHILINNRTYLPTFFFILLTSSFLPLQTINPAVFAVFFIILAIDNLLSANNSSHHLDFLFKAGFFCSIASLFYLPAAVYLLLVFIALIILNLGGIRPWLVSIAGFLTPWFFAFFYYYFFMNRVNTIPQIIISATIPLDHHLFYAGYLFTGLYIFSGLLFAVSALFLIKAMSIQKINVRKFHSILLWSLLIIAITALTTPFCSAEVIYFLAVPFSFILTTFFISARSKFWKELLFTVMIAFTILMQFFSS